MKAFRTRLHWVRRWLPLIGAIGLAVVCAAPAVAQQGWPNWRLPWDNPEPRPRRPAPPPADTWRPAPQPPAAEPYARPPAQQPYAATTPGARGNPICLQLEQRLAQEANRGRGTVDRGAQVAGEIRQTEQALNAAQSQLERGDCWEFFLFQKTLRRTRACYDANRRVEDSRRRLQELDIQRQQLASSGGRSYQDDIIRELARNNCGAAYTQEAHRRDQQSNPFSSLWQDGDSRSGPQGNTFGGLPFATYRTMCVRLCDGFYFPVSFSTLPTHFGRDAEICQSKCAAPAELYFYQNPGGAIDQMLSQKTNEPYTGLRTAFRYRKEYIKGCSCKQTEYSPAPAQAPTGRRADAALAGQQAAVPQRR